MGRTRPMPTAGEGRAMPHHGGDNVTSGMGVFGKRSIGMIIGGYLMQLFEEVITKLFSLIVSLVKYLFSLFFVSMTITKRDSRKLFHCLEDYLHMNVSSQNLRKSDLISRWRMSFAEMEEIKKTSSGSSSATTTASKQGNNTLADASKNEADAYMRRTRPYLLYLPQVGLHHFFYKYIPFFVYNSKEKVSSVRNVGRVGMQQESTHERRTYTLYMFAPIVLSYLIPKYFNARDVFNTFFSDILEQYEQLKRDNIWVFSLGTTNSEEWERVMSLKGKTVESAVMDPKLRDEFVKDISQFIDAEAWYAEHGIPYRRNYLISGPSGSGKTALCIALAAHFNRSLCVCSIDQLYDEYSLESVLRHLPDEKLFLVIDGVDEACTHEELEKAMGNIGTLNVLSKQLNSLEKQDGVIAFYCTSYPDELPDSLTRQMDKRIVLSKASKYQIKALFTRIYPNEPVEKAEKLAEMIPAKSCTTAQIMSMLAQFNNRVDEMWQQIDTFVTNCKVEYKEQLKKHEMEKKKAQFDTRMELKYNEIGDDELWDPSTAQEKDKLLREQVLQEMAEDEKKKKEASAQLKKSLINV